MGKITCFVLTCSGSSDPNVSYHRVPKEEKMRQIWLKACGQNLDGIIIKTARICANHFEKDCFERNLKAELMADYGRTANNRVRVSLKPGSIPTLHLPQGSNEGTTHVHIIEKDEDNIRNRLSVSLLPSEIKKKKRDVPVPITIVPHSALSSSVGIQAQAFHQDATSQTNFYAAAFFEWKNDKKKLLSKIKILEDRLNAFQELQLKISSRKAETRKLRNELLSRFSPSQVDVLMNKKGGKRRPKSWSPEDIDNARILKSMCGGKAYNFLQKKFPLPLPALTTLRKWDTKKHVYSEKASSSHKMDALDFLEEEDEECQEEDEENALERDECQDPLANP